MLRPYAWNDKDGLHLSRLNAKHVASNGWAWPFLGGSVLVSLYARWPAGGWSVGTSGTACCFRLDKVVCKCNSSCAVRQGETELAQRVSADVQRRSFDVRRSLDGPRPGRASLDLPRAASSGLYAAYGADYGAAMSTPYGSAYGPPATGAMLPGAYGGGGGPELGSGGGPLLGSSDGSLEALMLQSGAAAARAAAAALAHRRFSMDGLLEARGGDARSGAWQHMTVVCAPVSLLFFQENVPQLLHFAATGCEVTCWRLNSAVCRRKTILQDLVPLTLRKPSVQHMGAMSVG